MDSTTPRLYGKSTSMPLLPSYTDGEAEQDRAMEQSWQQVLEEVQLSPHYKILLEESGASTHTARQRRTADSPTNVSYNGESESMGSPQSDDTIRPGDVLDSGGRAVTLKPSNGVVGSSVHGSVTHLSPIAPVLQSTSGTMTISQGSNTADNHTQHPPTSITPSAFGTFNTRSPVKNYGNGNLMMDHQAPGTPTFRSSFHRRRGSSKFSFLPVLPSPLGPGHVKHGLSSDVSGLFSPTPATAPLLHPPVAPWNSAPVPKTTVTPASDGIPFSWTQSTPQSFQPFDLSPVSDPFVERSPLTVTGASPCAPHWHGAPTPTTPHHLPSQQQETLPNGAGWTSNDTGISSIPPAPLPIAQSVRQPDPQSRSRLDAQKALRKDWILTEARKIANLARMVATLKQQYHRTRSPEDYEAWVHALSLFEDATSLEKRIEERRNLTLPNGMRALKTGPDNIAGDAMIGKEGGLFGFKMALMERICAEAVVKENGCKIAAKNLNEEEKQALRKAAMADVEAAIKRRLGRQTHRVPSDEPVQEGDNVGAARD